MPNNRMKDIGFIVLARLLVIVCQFINVKLYTHYLSAAQLGVYFFLLSISLFANALIFGPVDYYQQANLANIIKFSGGLHPLLFFNLKLIAIYIFVVFLLLMVNIFAALHFEWQIILAAALSVAIYVVQMMRNILNNLEHKGVVSFSLVQEAMVKVIIFLFFAKYFSLDELMLMMVWLIALIITAISLVLRANEYGLFFYSEKHSVGVKEVFHFSYPFSIGAVCNWLQQQGYRLVLVPLGFVEEVGVFATLSSIGSAAIGAISLIYSQQYTPLIYKTRGQYTGKYLKGAIAVIISVTLIFFWLGDFVVKILTHSEFESHWKLLLFGLITDGGFLFTGALAIHISLTDNTKKIISSSTLGVLTMVVCFTLLFWKSEISVNTIGIPLLVSQWIVVIYMYLIYKKTI